MCFIKCFQALRALCAAVAIFAVPPDLTAAPSSAGLTIVALGTGGPASPGRASSSFVILLDGQPRILVDAGGGAFARWNELNLSPDNLDLVLLTHLHIDHSADLPAFFKGRGVTHNGPYEFKVFGPSGGGEFPGVEKWLSLLFGKRGAFAYQPDFNAHETLRPFEFTGDMKVLPKTIHENGKLRIQAVATHHGDCPSVAYRVDYGSASVTFSGDMDASALPNLVALARETNLLVFNSVVLDPPGSPEVLYELHSPPAKIGEASRDAKVGRLLLSHLGPAILKHVATVRKSIGKSYNGRVELAEDKARYHVGQD